MFYSESLLSKTGPLARVWLASNVERKLSKQQILQSDIQSSVEAMIDQGQAPMALRLSGQLMLGVVRIYGRKARYLLDDCNDALMKIRMTFKNTTSHDMPLTTTTATDLNLPELLTVDDLFPSLDLAFPMSQVPAFDANTSLHDFGADWTSTLNPQHSTQSMLTPEDQPLNQEDDLGLDFGEDVGLDGNDTSISIQVGRNAPAARPLGDDLFSDDNRLLNDDDDLALDFGEDVPMPDQSARRAAPDLEPVDPVGGDDVVMGDDETLQLQRAAAEPGADSLLADAPSAMMRDLDLTYANPEDDLEEVAARQPQRSKKPKPLLADVETILHNKQIKAQADDRSKILKPATFLPRDPFLLTLMKMQKNGDFVSHVMNDGQARHWAPELQGLLSFDAVNRSGDRKRKRDSGIADISDAEHSEKSPRLELPDDDHDALAADEGVDFGTHHEPLDLPAEDEQVPPDEEEEGIDLARDDGGFDDTTLPLVHPADSGPVSLGTKHAVHLLRERFGGSGSADASPAASQKRSVLLQELVPERTTSKEDATKMFFEMLVLATKDAIKVEQSDKGIGGPLRVRAKRGLWGSWAETNPEEDPSVVREREREQAREGIAV